MQNLYWGLKGDFKKHNIRYSIEVKKNLRVFFQLSHGEPSWVPGSGVQSPVMSETDLTSLAGHQYDESSISSTPVEHMEELLPHQEAESHSGDFSGQSDGLPSHPNGRGDDEESGKYQQSLNR